MLEWSESDAIAWLPHGRAFQILDESEFMDAVAPLFFRLKKTRSFHRQLHLWGFKRISMGLDSCAWYHELFLRGRPDNNIWKKVRVKTKGAVNPLPMLADSNVVSPLPSLTCSIVMPPLPNLSDPNVMPPLPFTTESSTMSASAARGRRVSMETGPPYGFQFQHDSPKLEAAFSRRVSLPPQLDSLGAEAAFPRRVSLPDSVELLMLPISDGRLCASSSIHSNLESSMLQTSNGRICVPSSIHSSLVGMDGTLASPAHRSDGPMGQRLGQRSEASVFPTDEMVKRWLVAGRKQVEDRIRKLSSAMMLSNVALGAENRTRKLSLSGVSSETLPAAIEVKDRLVAGLEPLPFDENKLPPDEFANYIDNAIQML